jgi:pimeloyl-ACP methyl ester carboxylesterase
MALLCFGRVAQAELLLDTALGNARLHQHGRLTAYVLEQLMDARAASGDLARTRAYAREALDVWNAIGVDRTAVIASSLGEAEFRAGNVERALELAQQSVAAARRLPRARNLAGFLVNVAAYAIACERWDDAVAASGEALDSSQETDPYNWSAFALQHIVAAAVLPGGAMAEPELARDAALVIGSIDARIAELGAPREFTEQQEYERVRIALNDALGPTQFEQLAAAGAALSAEAAKALALSLHCDDERYTPCGLA